MAVTSDGSPKPVKGRMAHGVDSRKRRSSKARSSISGDSWDQSSLPFSSRQAPWGRGPGRSTAAPFRHDQKSRLHRPDIQPASAQVIRALNQNSEQVRPFDAFVDAPSPFAKQKIDAKNTGNSHPHPPRPYPHPYPRPHSSNYSVSQRHNSTFTKTFTSSSQPNLNPASSPCYFPPFAPPPLVHHNFANEIPLPQNPNMNSNRMSQRTEGYLDAGTREANLQHTRPEWTTWDFVELSLSNLPPGIRTFDIWDNFRTEGEIDYIDIKVTPSGQKDHKATLRFRPPPRRDFFTSSNRYLLTLKDSRTWAISVQLDRKQRKTFTHPSPVNEKVTYPDTTELSAESIDFGVLVAPASMLIKRTRHSTARGRVKMVLNLGRREIDIRFPSAYADKIREYKFTVPIDQVFDLSQFQAQNDTKTSFILTLRTPPHFYKKLSGGIVSTHDEAAFNWKEEDAWLRQTNVLSHPHEVAQLRARPITLKNTPEGIVNIGRWTTYRITIDDQSIDKEKYRVFRAALKDYNVAIAKAENFVTSLVSDPPWDLLDASLSEHDPVPFSSSAKYALEHSLHGLLNSGKNEIYLPFPVRYQLDVCISNGWINEHNLSREFLQTLSKTDHDRAKYILETVALNEIRVFEPMEIFNIRVRRLPSMRSKIPDNCVLIHSVIITPSTMILNTPYLEMTNRVIRKYREHSDRFLRVRFEDDERRGYARINATSQKTMDEVLSRVFRTLSSGIVIGDRHYEFLAFGNSQLREHGAYFFASLSTGTTASHIRAWMGHFQHERIVAKHAARIGQCFSTTRAIKNAGFPPVRKGHLIDDVERNGFNFTDGVGKISRFYAETIARELNIQGPPPSVYQFRMAGCKGVLAIAPGLGATNVQIRQSQFKFETSYSGMEIIRWSEYWVATLNRQLILVLSALGVPDEIFLSIQDQEIQLLERAMMHDSAALEALTGHVDPNRMTLTIAGLVQAGFRRSNEPFVTSLLGLWRAWSIKYLKEKARLPVREGACILGCTDETSTLRGHFNADQGNDDEENEAKVAKLPEVFVQITLPDSGHRKVIQGLCFIARNPSLHPGDIRVVQAIDVPALHHLVDVLVLPQTGDRDLSSMCSGGDLDGDDYVVVWDERLLPKIWNAEPMDYTPPHPTPLERDVTQTDITRFFVKYMKNDFLPKIAHAHLAWADYLNEGIRHRICLDLAQLHSKAVDYPKTGQPAQMPKALNAKKWPHFMEKKGRNGYISHRILGQLYDAVDRVAFVPNYDAPFDERIIDYCEPDQSTMQDAREVKNEYDASLQRIMAQHDIKTEFEVWSTFVLDHSKASKDYKFHEEIGQLSSSLKQQYYGAILDKAGGKGWRQLVPWAVAMYRVTKEELEAAKRQGKGAAMAFISFPWLLQSTLVQIVKAVDSLANNKHDPDGGEILNSVQERAFNQETQVYDDPFQPGTFEPREGRLDDPQQRQPSIGKHQSALHDLISRNANVDVDVPTTVYPDPHHISNDGFSSGPYALGLRIPPQPTAEQFALIEKMINDPESPSTSPKDGSDSLGASERRKSRVSVMDDHADDVAANGRMDFSWPAIKPSSSKTPSLDTSEETKSKSSGELVGDSSVVRTLPQTSVENRLVGLSGRISSTRSGILVDLPQAHGEGAQGPSATCPISSSLSEELAGLQLQPALSVPPHIDELEDIVNKNVGRSTPQAEASKVRESSSSLMDDPIVESGNIPLGRARLAQTSINPSVGDEMHMLRSPVENTNQSYPQRENHNLIIDGSGSAQGDQEEDDDEVIILDPLASAGGEENNIDRLMRLNGL